MAKNIVVVTGSRADYGLLEPVLDQLHDKCNLTLVVTGSHLSKQYGETVHDIKDKYHQILVPGLVDYDEPIGVCQTMGLLINGLATAIQFADAIVLLGDRHEILAAALAAYNFSIPIHHIQGGDITVGSLDDGYRDCITKLARHHYVAHEKAGDRVQWSTGKSTLYHTYVVGSLACVLPDVEPRTDYDFIVAFHPCKDDNLHEYIAELTEYPNKMLLLGSNADAGGRQINQILKALEDHNPDQFEYVPSMEREVYLSYLAGAKAVIGNSSSGIFEAPMVKTPTINIGTRQRGRLQAGSVFQVDRVGDLVTALEWISGEDFLFDCPYYKPDTVERIVEGILS